MSEKIMFMEILDELLDYLIFEKRQKKVGRPSISPKERLFSAVMYGYCGLSSRRTVAELKLARKIGFTSKAPHFNTILNVFSDERIKEVLKELVRLSSLPLTKKELYFAVDSTGFHINKYERWFNIRFKKYSSRSKFAKLHVIIGTESNVVTDAIVTRGDVGDSLCFKGLIKNTAKNFEIKEVSADKAYSSRENVKVVYEVKGIPYIPFRSNASGKSRGTLYWHKLFEYYKQNPEEFMQHYHRRSNVESTFSMMKRKFNHNLRMKKGVAQINELLIKCLCHNVCVLIQEIFESKISVDFENYINTETAQKLMVAAHKLS